MQSLLIKLYIRQISFKSQISLQNLIAKPFEIFKIAFYRSENCEIAYFIQKLSVLLIFAEN